jgi:hypothetical protein
MGQHQTFWLVQLPVAGTTVAIVAPTAAATIAVLGSPLIGVVIFATEPINRTFAYQSNLTNWIH